MKEIALSNHELALILLKTKELYVKEYTSCLLKMSHSYYSFDDVYYSVPVGYIPHGLCYTFLMACHCCGYNVPEEFNVSNYAINKIIKEWNKEIAYKISPLNESLYDDGWSVNYGFWYPIWDKASRVNFLNWLLNKYSK